MGIGFVAALAFVVMVRGRALMVVPGGAVVMRRCCAGVMPQRHADARAHRRDSLYGNGQRDEQDDNQAKEVFRHLL